MAEAAQKADQAITRREEQIPEEHSSDADSSSPVGPTKKDLKMARTRLRWITETEIPKVSKYEGQLQTLGDRNSYSKTDPDVTFMRTGDQSPFDKLLAAGYNLQMGTQNQYVLGYSIHSNAADKVKLEEQLDSLSFTSQWICADAGYELLTEAGITGVIKTPSELWKAQIL